MKLKTQMKKNQNLKRTRYENSESHKPDGEVSTVRVYKKKTRLFQIFKNVVKQSKKDMKTDKKVNDDIVEDEDIKTGIDEKWYDL